MCNFEPNDDLYRGIRPEWWSYSDNRPTSAAFNDYDMSVDWSKYSSSKQSFERYIRLSGLDTATLISIKVKAAENLAQEVVWNPCEIKGEYNHSHTLIKGKKTKSIARKFARDIAQVVHKYFYKLNRIDKPHSSDGTVSRTADGRVESLSAHRRIAGYLYRPRFIMKRGF